MTEFNLERALAGDKLVTREGKAARNFVFDKAIAHSYSFDLDGDKYYVTEEGKVCTDQDSALDLFMAEEVFDPKPGDVVEVSMTNDNWRVRTFLFTLDRRHYCIFQQGEHPPTEIDTGKVIVFWSRIRKHVVKHAVKITIDGVVRMDEEMTQEELDKKFIL